MSKTKRTLLFTDDIITLQKLIEDNNKEQFYRKYKELKGRLWNCSVGDTYLQQTLIKLCYNAIDRFIY